MKIKKSIGFVVLAMVVTGLLAGTVWTVRAYRQPIGPALASSAADTTVKTAVQSVSSDAVTQAQTAVCDETATWNILVLGSDADERRFEAGADLTRVLRVDFPNKKVTIYTFTRDLWVDSTGLGLTNPSIDATQLGMVFYEARSRSAQTGQRASMIDGASAMGKMLFKNFTLSNDHYVAMDLSQLPAVVDAIGGVSINVPARITDPIKGITIEPGQQVLNGNQVVAYARADPDSDFARISRNNLLVDALRQKLIDPTVWAKIPELFTKFSAVIATDISPEQVNHLACLMKEVPSTSIVQTQIKPEWTTPGPVADSLLWDKTQVLKQLKELGLIQ